MSYEQAMKHWGNHRKDRYHQQCSGWFGPVSEDVRLSDEKYDVLAIDSMFNILEASKIDGFPYPVYLAQDNKIGVWKIVPHNHIGGTKIDDKESLRVFSIDYCFDVVRPNTLYRWCVKKCIEKKGETEADYAQSDMDAGTWRFAGIHEREGIDAIIRFVEEYKGQPKRKPETRGYA